jgi:hypothetical protein
MPGVEVLQHLWQLFALKKEVKNLSYPARPAGAARTPTYLPTCHAHGSAGGARV